jgi:DNA/RNA endonuclease YhcR with UshA esterase domain
MPHSQMKLQISSDHAKGKLSTYLNTTCAMKAVNMIAIKATMTPSANRRNIDSTELILARSN